MNGSLSFRGQVQQYLADCAAAPGLDRRYHPTEDGAVKLIWHRGEKQENQIRTTFRALSNSESRTRSVAPATLPPGPQERAAQITLLGDESNAHTAA